MDPIKEDDYQIEKGPKIIQKILLKPKAIAAKKNSSSEGS
jgi:hypothetical protein